MPRKWDTQEVTKHGSGITDDIENAPPSFQDECHNLIYDHQTHNLTNRFGSQILRDSNGDILGDLPMALDLLAVDQIFQLENKVLINATSKNDDGKIIVLDEQTNEVVDAETVFSDKGMDQYNPIPSSGAHGGIVVATSVNKGIEGALISAGLDGNNTNHIDHLVFDFVAINAYDPASIVLVNYKDRLNVCHVQVNYNLINDDGTLMFDQDFQGGSPSFGIRLEWGDIMFALDFHGNHQFNYILGTTSGDPVYLDGDLTLSGTQTRTFWGVEPSVVRNPMTSFGHIQSSVYSGESYIALEPYDKTFVVNPLDKDMTDSENFPPTTNRATIKRISNFWDGIVGTPTVRDAQLPQTYLDLVEKEPLDAYRLSFGLEVTEYDLSTLDSGYKYVRFRWGITETNTFDLVFHYLDIWIDRVSGFTNNYPVGVSEDSPLPVVFRVAGGTLPDDTFVVVDKVDINNDLYGLNAEMGSLTQGQIFIVYSGTETSIDSSDWRDKVQVAFDDYRARPDRYYKGLGAAVLAGPGFTDNRLYGINAGDYAWTYTSHLPEDVGKYAYNYGYHLQESYVKLDDEVPKTVANNGPASFLQVNALSPIGVDNNFVEWWAPPDIQGDQFPTVRNEIIPGAGVVGSISKRFTNVTQQWFDFNDIEGVFSRTQNTGTNFYEAYRSSWFKPIAMAAPIGEFDPAEWGGEDYGYFVDLVDRTVDEDLLFNELPYYAGDVLSYSGLPQGSYFQEIVNGTSYYGNIVNNASRVFQSAPGIPSSSPNTLFSDFEDPITAVSSFLDKPIVFTENTTWRLEGVKDQTGNGRVFQRVVSDEFGCISNQSVVKTNIGLFYWSKAGIIFTDGLRATRVNEHLLARFETWKDAMMPNGLEVGTHALRSGYNEITKRIYWSSLDPVTKAENWIILDVYFGITSSMPFYTAGGPALLGDDLQPSRSMQTRVIWFSEDLSRFYRGQIGWNENLDDFNGSVILTQERNLTNDEAYETLSDTGFKVSIDFLYKSIAFSFGSIMNRKWVSKAMINFRDLQATGVSVQPLGWNDLNKYEQLLGKCQNYQHFIEPLPQTDGLYDQGFPPSLQMFFQNMDAILLGYHLISYKRRFPRGKIRAVYKQFGFRQLVTDYSTITAGEGGITSITLSRTIDVLGEPVQMDFVINDEMENSFISSYLRQNGSSYVLYEGEYKVVTRVGYDGSSGSLTFLTSNKTLTVDPGPTDIASVQIGKSPLDQDIQLSSYALTFSNIGDKTHGLPKPAKLGGRS